MPVDPDPDAIWKPGYTGGVRFDTTEPTRHRRPGRRILSLIGAVVVISVALGVVVTIAGRSDTDPASMPEPPAQPDLAPVVQWSRPRALPPTGEPIWSMSLPGPADQQRVAAVAGTHDTVVMVIGRPGTLVALETTDGSVRWSTPAPGASVTSLAVLDGVAVLGHVAGNGSEVVRGVDLRSGAILWRRSLGRGERFTAEVSALVWRSRTLGDRPPGVDRLDPRTGLLVDSVGGSDVRIGVASVQRYSEGLIEWFDAEDLRAVRTWRIVGFGVDTFRPPGRLELLDADLGIVAAQRESDLVVGQLIGAVEGSERFEFRWSMPGRLAERSPGGDRLAVSQQGVESVVSLATGEVLGQGRPLQPQRHRNTYHLADQGWLLRRADGVVEASNAAGELRWGRGTPVDAQVTLVDGGVVSIVATETDPSLGVSIEVWYWR